jgi:hypothetical protein
VVVGRSILWIWPCSSPAKTVMVIWAREEGLEGVKTPVPVESRAEGSCGDFGDIPFPFLNDSIRTHVTSGSTINYFRVGRKPLTPGPRFHAFFRLLIHSKLSHFKPLAANQ